MPGQLAGGSQPSWAFQPKPGDPELRRDRLPPSTVFYAPFTATVADWTFNRGATPVNSSGATISPGLTYTSGLFGPEPYCGLDNPNGFVQLRYGNAFPTNYTGSFTLCGLMRVSGINGIGSYYGYPVATSAGSNGYAIELYYSDSTTDSSGNRLFNLRANLYGVKNITPATSVYVAENQYCLFAISRQMPAGVWSFYCYNYATGILSSSNSSATDTANATTGDGKITLNRITASLRGMYHGTSMALVTQSYMTRYQFQQLALDPFAAVRPARTVANFLTRGNTFSPIQPVYTSIGACQSGFSIGAKSYNYRSIGVLQPMPPTANSLWVYYTHDLAGGFHTQNGR